MTPVPGCKQHKDDFCEFVYCVQRTFILLLHECYFPRTCIRLCLTRLNMLCICAYMIVCVCVCVCVCVYVCMCVCVCVRIRVNVCSLLVHVHVCPIFFFGVGSRGQGIRKQTRANKGRGGRGSKLGNIEQTYFLNVPQVQW